MLKAGFVLDGKYRILSVIGQGGMSTVYLAVHERLKQKWAVKEISMEYCENYEMISRKLIVEADILKRLDHPGLPKIVDIIEKKDAIWMVMEFIEGKTLKEILNERGRIEEKEILIWGKQLCEVLSYLHSKKPSIIYRDLKPENIILKKTGRLVLIDLGRPENIVIRIRLVMQCILERKAMQHQNNMEVWGRQMRGRIFIAWESRFIAY